MSPRVSIGLPVFDGEAFLETAIDSILCQTFRDFELILSDNGSTDRTPEICRAYAERDPRVRWERSDTNRGAAWNFNRVVELARGEYFKWVAHDDACAPAFVERCVEVLDGDPEVVLSYPRALDIDEEGRVIGENHWPLPIDDPRADQRFRYLICPEHPCLVVFGVMRTEVLRRTRLIGNYVASDRVLLADLGLRGRFRQVPEPLLLHRQHPGRSVRAFRDARKRLAWFDPKRAKRIPFPEWRLLREYIGLIRRVPLGGGERARCAVQILRWLAWHHRPLARDLVAVAGYLAGRA
ncbi:MAG: glycosyltransferase [Planctomycetes bacterium]|nr:glycosyltransferase [Planctomycetota bacterium]